MKQFCAMKVQPLAAMPAGRFVDLDVAQCVDTRVPITCGQKYSVTAVHFFLPYIMPTTRAVN